MTEKPLRDAQDVEKWVRVHGYKRFRQAFDGGEFRGVSLRSARIWDVRRAARRTAIVAWLVAGTATGLIAVAVLAWRSR